MTQLPLFVILWSVGGGGALPLVILCKSFLLFFFEKVKSSLLFHFFFPLFIEVLEDIAVDTDGAFVIVISILCKERVLSRCPLPFAFIGTFFG